MLRRVLAEVLAGIKADGLLSDEHFTVDGTQLEAWASPKSFKPKGGTGRPPDDRERIQLRIATGCNAPERHASSDDRSDARLYTKAVGREAKLGYLAHLLTENSHG